MKIDNIDVAALVGTHWRHKKTDREYVVTGICLREMNLEEHILYRALETETNHTWARPVAEFLDGRFVRVKGKKVKS